MPGGGEAQQRAATGGALDEFDGVLLLARKAGDRFLGGNTIMRLRAVVMRLHQRLVLAEARASERSAETMGRNDAENAERVEIAEARAREAEAECNLLRASLATEASSRAAAENALEAARAEFQGRDSQLRALRNEISAAEGAAAAARGDGQGSASGHEEGDGRLYMNILTKARQESERLSSELGDVQSALKRAEAEVRTLRSENAGLMRTGRTVQRLHEVIEEQERERDVLLERLSEATGGDSAESRATRPVAPGSAHTPISRKWTSLSTEAAEAPGVLDDVREGLEDDCHIIRDPLLATASKSAPSSPLRSEMPLLPIGRIQGASPPPTSALSARSIMMPNERHTMTVASPKSRPVTSLGFASRQTSNRPCARNSTSSSRVGVGHRSAVPVQSYESSGLDGWERGSLSLRDDLDSITMLQAAAERGRAGSQAAEASLTLRSIRKTSSKTVRAKTASAAGARVTESISSRAAAFQLQRKVVGLHAT